MHSRENWVLLCLESQCLPRRSFVWTLRFDGKQNSLYFRMGHTSSVYYFNYVARFLNAWWYCQHNKNHNTSYTIAWRSILIDSYCHVLITTFESDLRRLTWPSIAPQDSHLRQFWTSLPLIIIHRVILLRAILSWLLTIAVHSFTIFSVFLRVPLLVPTMCLYMFR